MKSVRFARVRSLWQRYLTWRRSPARPRVTDQRPDLLKADVDPELLNRQSRALSTEMSGGSGG